MFMIANVTSVFAKYGKVMVLKSNHQRQAPVAVLATNTAGLVPGRESWRQNRHNVLVAGTSDVAFAHYSSFLAALDADLFRSGIRLGASLPVFSPAGQNLIQDHGELLVNNGVETFMTMEDYGGRSRCYIASVSRGWLVCDNQARYGERDLERVDWSRHGLIFVLPPQNPCRDSAFLGISPAGEV